MESQRIRVMSTRWPLTVCSVDHCLRRTMALRAGGQATLYHPQQHRSIPLSKFCGLCVFEDASSMQACAVEATVEIKIMAGDELLCRIPKMTDGIGDGVSLRKDTTQQRRQLEPPCPGQLRGVLAGPLPVPLNNETYFSVCVKRTREWCSSRA